MTAIGWKAIKFVGKKIWKGIKSVFFKTVGAIGALFKVGAKFVNKVANWIPRIGRGIRDKVYQFVVKPIASMMVSVFNFVSSISGQSMNFMKWLIPSMFDRIKSFASNALAGIKACLNATMGWIRRILFNPLTLKLLIGGIFIFFGAKLIMWLTRNWKYVKENVVPAIVGFVKKTWSILKTIWEVMKTVGTTVFNLVNTLTKPTGPIAKAVSTIIKVVFLLKKYIKNMLKTAGKSSIETFCMFLSGDYLGIAISMIGGYVTKLWNWMKHRGILKTMLDTVKAIGAVYVMIGTMHITMMRSLVSAAWAGIKALAGKGKLSGVADAFVKPWKQWWKLVSGLFSSAFSSPPPDPDKEYLSSNPVEDLAKQES